jgi:hypothetical protein
VSYLARLIRNGSRAFSEAENVPAAIGRDPASGSVSPGEEVPGYAASYDASAPTLSRSAHLRIAGQRLDLMHRGRRPRFDALAARVFETLRGFAQEVEASGARFVVMIIPDEIQIDTELRDEVLHRSGRSEAEFDLDLPQRSLAEFFDRHDIEYVDLLPVFRERGARTRLYRTRDTHWNPAGNRLAASQLLERW